MADEKRFELVLCGEARERNLESAHAFYDEHDFCWVVYERKEDGSLSWVGDDRAEPEDKTLARDLSWVLDKLNEQAAASDRMRETLRQVLAAWDAETAEMLDGAPEPERNVYDVLSDREPWLWEENDDG
jgi:hypothetical protein